MTVEVPSNEEFLKIVKDYYERFPSFGSLFAVGVTIAGYYRSEGINMDEQMKHFILTT